MDTSKSFFYQSYYPFEGIYGVGTIVILFNRDSIGFNIFYTFYDFFNGVAFYIITRGESIFDKFLKFDVELFFKR